jgi:FMN phosphatase YigB (HAD superfamily)
MNALKAVIFDWGDTVMRDFPEYKGPMAYWPIVEIIKGIDKTLEYLQNKLICCLASNAGDSDAELMGIALSRTNLRPYFQHLFTSHELGAKKPDPIFYSQLLRKLDLEPEQCIVVGNDYQKDIVPAKSIGMITIWFSQHTDAASVPCADYSIDSIDKSLFILEELLKR